MALPLPSVAPRRDRVRPMKWLPRFATLPRNKTHHRRPGRANVVDTADPALMTTERPALRTGDGEIDQGFVALIEAAIASGDGAALTDLAGDLHEADLGALIERIEHDSRPRFIALMGREFDFAALTEVDDAIREDILEELPNETIAEGVKDLDTDDAVYILEDLDQADKDAVLAQLPLPDRTALAKSLDYPEHSAGRRMQTEFIAVPPFWSVGQTIDYMRETADLPDRFFGILVVDPGYHLVGEVPLDRLLRNKRPVLIEDLMEEAEHVVAATDDQEEPARLFRTYNLVEVPVVDEERRLVGVLTFDDIVDLLDEEADAEIKALGGVKAEEEISDTVWTITRSRFTWLLVNLLTAILASGVIALFEKSLEKMVALAVLMPIVASMGGNAGTQSLTVAVRALATKELDRSNAMRIVRRELVVGLLNGLAFAVIMGVIAVAWYGPLSIGPVIGLAIVITLAAAALGGIVIPLLLDRAGVDPAVSSGPLVTTVTDVVGFFAFLGIASLWFGL
jgi:magnesium transporter